MKESRPIHPDFQSLLNFKEPEVIDLFCDLRNCILEFYPESNELLSLIVEQIENEKPEVQWAMNFTAAQIGIFQPELRSRCIVLGERIGLYKYQIVPKGCTPSYLPELISIQVAKMEK